jgi:hypothetical protein
VKTEVLNPHHRRRSPSSDSQTLTLYCYKKYHLNLGHSLYHSTMSLFCLLSSQSTTSSELHPPPLFPFIVIPRSSFMRITTPTVMN